MKIRILHPAAAALLTLGLSAAFAQPLNAPTIYNFSTPVLQPGEPVHGMLTEADGQNFKDGSRVHVFFFTGEQGETVSLTLGSNEFDTWLTVYAPDGSLLDYNDDSWAGSFPTAWQSALDLTLPEAGRYTAVVTAYSADGLGDYELVLSSAGTGSEYGGLGRAKEAETLTVGSSLTVHLDPSLPITGEGYDGPGRLYDLHVDQDLLVMIRAYGEGVDAVLMLYDAEGNFIDFNDTISYDPSNPENYWPARLTLPLTAGDYQLLVGGYSSYDIGDVNLAITGYVPLP